MPQHAMRTASRLESPNIHEACANSSSFGHDNGTASQGRTRRGEKKEQGRAEGTRGLAWARPEQGSYKREGSDRTRPHIRQGTCRKGTVPNPAPVCPLCGTRLSDLRRQRGRESAHCSNSRPRQIRDSPFGSYGQLFVSFSRRAASASSEASVPAASEDSDE